MRHALSTRSSPFVLDGAIHTLSRALSRSRNEVAKHRGSVLVDAYPRHLAKAAHITNRLDGEPVEREVCKVDVRLSARVNAEEGPPGLDSGGTSLHLGTATEQRYTRECERVLVFGMAFGDEDGRFTSNIQVLPVLCHL